jgi:polyphosphate kinase 2 (PPK2 family)
MAEHEPPSGEPSAPDRMSEKDYQRELRRLHGELVVMQHWVKATGARICVVFEGRDTAGKGGVIKAITERVSSRVFRVVALPAPTERERSQMYLQRYVPHLPGAGDVVIFDRSWYNRAGVERVLGFCTEDQAQQFLADDAGTAPAPCTGVTHPYRRRSTAVFDDNGSFLLATIESFIFCAWFMCLF